MKILYIVQHFCGPSGSWSTRAYECARRLVKMGHEVTLLCGKFDRSSERDITDAVEAGINIIQAPICYHQEFSFLKRMINFRQYMSWVYKVGTELPAPDLVFASSPPLTVGDVGRQVAAYHAVPFAFEVRDPWPEVAVSLGALKNPIMRHMANKMAKRIYDASDLVVALSSDMKDLIKSSWGVPGDRIIVVPNCSDTSLFGSREFRDSERTRMGWNDKFVCIHPGAIGIMNGLDYLLDVAKLLDERGITDIHIPIVGSGALKAHLAERIKNEGIRSAALYDAVQKQDMPKILSAADVGIAVFAPKPHLEKNSANKFFDFLATGLPVVINYGGWQAKVLSETGAGVSVDPHNPSEMVEALISMRDNPQRIAQMGRAARQLAEERYDRDLLVTQLEAALRRTVAEELPLAA